MGISLRQPAVDDVASPRRLALLLVVLLDTGVEPAAGFRSSYESGHSSGQPCEGRHLSPPHKPRTSARAPAGSRPTATALPFFGGHVRASR
jgi:hypothetical protein